MSNTKKIESILKSADKAIDAKAAEVMEELQSVNLILPAIKSKAEDIADGITSADDVLSRLRQGEDVSPMDLLLARAEDEIAEVRFKALTSRKSALERALPVDTLVLAERVAGVLRRVMQGFPVFVTKADPRTWVFPDETAIVVVAENGIERNPFNGLVSGSVKVLLRRPGLYRPIPVEAFEKAARDERLWLEVKANVVGDEGGWVSVAGIDDKSNDPNAYVTDSLSVRVNNVVDGHAVIKRVETSGLPMRTWVERTFASNGSQAQGVPGTDKPYLWGVQIGPHLVATGWTPEIVSETVNEEGIRTLTVNTKVNTMRSEPYDFGTGLLDILEADHGLTFNGMGVLIDSEVEALNVNHENQTANFLVTTVFESKVA